MSTLSQFRSVTVYPLSTIGIGYGTGSGGSVTQATSCWTSVTLNKMSGEIIMNTSTAASDSFISFNLINSMIAATDIIIISAVETNSTGITSVIALPSPAGGSATIKVTSRSISWFPYLKLYFSIIKGATA